jgi:hypothetical protein
MDSKKYAKSIDRVIDDAENYKKFHRSFRPVYNPNAVLAAKGDLEAISKALREDRGNVTVISGLRELLTEGSTSPLFGSDTGEAKKAAAKLRSELPA